MGGDGDVCSFLIQTVLPLSNSPPYASNMEKHPECFSDECFSCCNKMCNNLACELTESQRQRWGSRSLGQAVQVVQGTS